MNAADRIAPAGPRVAGYRIERELGRGRRSVVYLARQDGRSRPVALKVGAADECLREYATLAALANPGVLEVFDGGRCGGQAFLAMEYAAHGSLAGLRGEAGAARTHAVMSGAARALAGLHGQGWVHRDVKPANLLLRADGSVALGDLGCAARTGQPDGLPPGTVVGTPRYAAPEQSSGAAAHPTADVYSLGVCLYEMLTGRPPFGGVTITELLGQHLLAPLPTLPQEHRLWQPLLDAMLAKEPARRPADGQAVLAGLPHPGPPHSRTLS